MTKHKIECHDCGQEVVILDKHDEINPKDLKHCPICGSENIETEE